MFAYDAFQVTPHYIFSSLQHIIIAKALASN